MRRLVLAVLLAPLLTSPDFAAASPQPVGGRPVEAEPAPARAAVTLGGVGVRRRRGSGIFLHVNGGGATAGCVSAPRAFIRRLMFRLDPQRVPVIAVGR